MQQQGTVIDVGYAPEIAAVITLAMFICRDVPSNRRPKPVAENSLAAKGYTPLPPFDAAKAQQEFAAQLAAAQQQPGMASTPI